MNALRLLPVVISSILLGAHFLRAGLVLLVLPALLFPVLLFIRRAWAARIVQIILIIGALEWVRSLVVLAAERYAGGQPWIRLAVILGAVAVFTGSSVLPFFFSRPLRKRYGLDDSLTENSST